MLIFRFQKNCEGDDFLHHITHINNLENILKNGLKSRNELLSQDIDFEDTADRKIVEKRGILNNYIPFHIDWIQDVHGIPYNYAIFEKNGYDNMIFLWVDPIKNNKKYLIKYFLYHPISNYAIEYNNLEDFAKNFKLEKEKLVREYAFDYTNQEVREFRMSEILILKNTIFLDSDWSIIVYSEESFKKVKELLEKHQNDYANIKILIKPNFF